MTLGIMCPPCVLIAPATFLASYHTGLAEIIVKVEEVILIKFC